MATKNIYEKLSDIQVALKAPKNQKNTFGNYNYRSAEDILENVKPICHENRTTLSLTDDVEEISNGIESRFYVKASATIYDWDSEASITVCAFAREPLSKKGMDESQITGTASSYARKYAMNGLFNIDDTKDVDTNEYRKESEGRSASRNSGPKKSLGEEFMARCKKLGADPKKILIQTELWKDGDKKVSGDAYSRAFQILDEMEEANG